MTTTLANVCVYVTEKQWRRHWRMFVYSHRKAAWRKTDSLGAWRPARNWTLGTIKSKCSLPPGAPTREASFASVTLTVAVRPLFFSSQIRMLGSDGHFCRLSRLATRYRKFIRPSSTAVWSDTAVVLLAGFWTGDPSLLDPGSGLGYSAHCLFSPGSG